MPEQPDSLRAADVDREFVAERLRNALNEGRLTLSEYDDRLRDTYSARTYGDLKGLLADLPDVVPTERSALVPSSLGDVGVPRPWPGHARRWLAGVWGSWLSTSLIVTAIWFATDADGDFWPKWVIVPWGAVLLAATVSGLVSGEPHRAAEREERRRKRREERRTDRGDETD